MPSTKTTLTAIRNKILGFGKENLEEMLHSMAEGAKLVSGKSRIRVYLEDLTRGALTCFHASGSHAEEIKATTFPIISGDAIVSAVFVSQYPAEFRRRGQNDLPQDHELAQRCEITASSLLPITSHGKSIGVVCIDDDLPGEVLSSWGKGLLLEFIGLVADNIDNARIYHQQLLLARRVEEYKRREAATLMVKSAVRLIDRLTLASVLVPIGRPDGSTALEILASHGIGDPVQVFQLHELTR